MISASLLGITLSILTLAPMPRDTIPEPDTVSTEEIPVPAVRPPATPDTTEALYYLIFDGRGEQFDEKNTPETILQTLRDQEFAITGAWAPVISSIKVPCAAPNVFPALVVKLNAPDESITELDFTANPGRIFPNCGVETFLYYDFD